MMHPSQAAILNAVRAHLLEYVIEAALLAAFMISACGCAVLLEHPAGPMRRRIASPAVRRALMGVAMGLTAIALVYSPWGQRSGAHMNPATTLTFLLLGKVAPVDAACYVCAQFLGGVAGVAVAALAMRPAAAHETVNYVVTAPGPRGVAAAWFAELGIACGMMFVVLRASNDRRLAPYTGLFAATALALYVFVEAPVSGTSLNPARTFGSAAVARQWRAIWVYFTAPVAGMLLAAGMYLALYGSDHVYCAKLNHGDASACIFRCRIADLATSGESPHGHEPTPH